MENWLLKREAAKKKLYDNPELLKTIEFYQLDILNGKRCDICEGRTFVMSWYVLSEEKRFCICEHCWYDYVLLEDCPCGKCQLKNLNKT